MSEAGSYAFVTGGASGIGRALTAMLVNEGAQVFIADRDIPGAMAFAAELNTTRQVVWTAPVDVTDWGQQVSAFQTAVNQFGRIDYVFPVAGLPERRAFPNRGKNHKGYEKADLAVIDVNLTAVVHTVSLALQQFRRQEVNKFGFRGKIGCVSSLCGLHPASTLPIYSAAKHGIVGFVRGFGKYLAGEQITMNAVCPHVVRTNMSPDTFYEKLQGLGLLTPMSSVVEALQSMLGNNDVSGECFEVGPRSGYTIKNPPEYSDEEAKMGVMLISERGQLFHEIMKD